MSRIDAAAKVAGAIRYAQDIQRPGQCYAALVRSPWPHARIIDLDAAAARALPGVLAVFTAEDLPDRRYGVHVRDVPLLAREEVRFVGERVAMVVAETRQAAEAAVERVAVHYEPLPAVTTLDEALAPGAVVVDPEPWRYPGALASPQDGPNRQWHAETIVGDLAQGWQQTVWRVRATYTAQALHQGYLEPHAYVAEVDADGRYHLWMPTKAPYALRQELGRLLEVDPDRIEIHPVALGGDFGGKGTPMDAPLCLSAAARLGRPIKLVLRFAEELTATNPRHDAVITVDVGCDGEGRLTAVELVARFNGGAYAGLKPMGTFQAALSVGDAYRLDAVHLVAERIYTHTVPRGNVRTPGAPQLYFAWESALDELAKTAGFSPVEFRRRNLRRSGDDRWGTRATEWRGVQTLDAALAAYQPQPAPAGWLSGTGIALYHRPTHAAPMTVRARRQGDRVTVSLPFPETGTGSHTVAQKAFAQALGRDPETVTIEQAPTSALAPSPGIGGSRATAGLMAAAAALAAQWQKTPTSDTVTVAVTPTDEPVTSFCVEVAQVWVDPETGAVRVPELVVAVDVANVVNPEAHRIQIEGGAVMGFGAALQEDLALADGRPQATNLAEYKLPTAADVPAPKVVLLTGGRGVGPANVKAVGELSNVPTAAAIANAIADATGVRIRDLPLTAERVYRALLPRVDSAGL
ncbi:MAG: xanthine dehydrogenase family protein molybdopterin-binding subunit [Firmicutes bacterium]|nr:xanthine dehydrogenase family protein molybdopterin-binding subunit [Alicyclobacillaceae bacterium]MCL6496407.1 xanthine dehydrogenase family protein molybdopterin-binding subunit [Bacillota bacterium]